MFASWLLDVASIVMAAVPCMALLDVQVKIWMACTGMHLAIFVPLYVSITRHSMLMAIFKAVAAHGLSLLTCAAFGHQQCASFVRQLSNSYKQAKAAAAEWKPPSRSSPSPSPSPSSATVEAVLPWWLHPLPKTTKLHINSTLQAFASLLRQVKVSRRMVYLGQIDSHGGNLQAVEACEGSFLSKFYLHRSGVFSSIFQSDAQGTQDGMFASQLLHRGSPPMGGPLADVQAFEGEPPFTRESSSGAETGEATNCLRSLTEAMQPLPVGSIYQSSILRRARVHIKIECGLKPKDLRIEALTNLVSSLHFSTPSLVTQAAMREGCLAISTEVVAVSGVQKEHCEADIVHKLCARVLGWLKNGAEISCHLVHGTRLDLQVGAHLCKCSWHAPTQEWQHHGTIMLPAKYTLAATPAVLLPLASMQGLTEIRQRQALPQLLLEQQELKPASNSTTCLRVAISRLSPSWEPVTVIGWNGTVPGHEGSRGAHPSALCLLARLGDQFCSQVWVLEQHEDGNEIFLLVQVSLPPLSAEYGRLHLELWHQQQLPFPQMQQQQQQQQLMAQGAQAQLHQVRTGGASFASAPPPHAPDPWACAGATLPETSQPTQLCIGVAASCSVLLVQSGADDKRGMVRELQAPGPSPLLAPFLADLADFLHETRGTSFFDGGSQAGGCAPDVMRGMVECGKAMLRYALCCGWGHTAQLLLDKLMGPIVGLTWPQVIGTEGDESSSHHSLLFSALQSKSPGTIRMVMQWGKRYGGKDWRWDWSQAAGAGCSCLQYVQGQPEGDPVREALLADDSEGSTLRVALCCAGAYRPPAAASNAGGFSQKQPLFTALLLACVKGFDGPFSGCGQHEAAYRQWCFHATTRWVTICCKLVIVFVCLGILKSMFHTQTSMSAMSNDVPLLLAYTVPYCCVLLAGPHSRTKKFFLEAAKLSHLAVLLLIGLRVVPAFLVTHLLHGAPYRSLLGWVTELFFRILHQAQLGALLLECAAKALIFTLVYSVMGWSHPLLMAVTQNALCLVVGIAFDVWNRSVYLQRSSEKAQEYNFKCAIK